MNKALMIITIMTLMTTCIEMSLRAAWSGLIFAAAENVKFQRNRIKMAHSYTQCVLGKHRKKSLYIYCSVYLLYYIFVCPLWDKLDFFHRVKNNSSVGMVIVDISLLSGVVPNTEDLKHVRMHFYTVFETIFREIYMQIYFLLFFADYGGNREVYWSLWCSPK